MRRAREQDKGTSQPQKKFKAAGGDAKVSKAPPKSGGAGGAKPKGKPFNSKGAGGNKKPFDKSSKPMCKWGADCKIGKGCIYQHPAKEPMTRQDQKRMKVERQLSRTHGDIVVKCKELWNKIREKKTTAEERVPLMASLIALCKGKVLELVNKHDASRIMQTVLKYGSDAQKLSVLEECKGHLFELSLQKHSMFMVKATLRYADEKYRGLILKELEGKIVKLGMHAVGSNVIEHAYDRVLEDKESNLLMQEFYGKEYIRLKIMDGEKGLSLEETLDKYPERLDAVVTNLTTILTRQSEKALMSYAFVHQLAYDFMKFAPPRAIFRLTPVLSEGIQVLLTTEKGCDVGVVLIKYASSKEKKKMLKALKGAITGIIKHPYAYRAVLAFLNNVDDTVLLRKSLIQEIEKDLPDICCDPYGSRVINHILNPEGFRGLVEADKKVIEETLVPVMGEDGNFKDGEMQPSCKKPAPVRRAELLAALQKDIEKVCINNIERLGNDSYGSEVLLEAAIAWRNPVLLDAIASLTTTNEKKYVPPAARKMMHVDLEGEEEGEEEEKGGEEEGEEEGEGEFGGEGNGEEGDYEDEEMGEGEEDEGELEDGEGEEGEEGDAIDDDDEEEEDEDEELEEEEEEESAEAEEGSDDDEIVPDAMPYYQSKVGHLLLKRLIKADDSVENAEKAFGPRIILTLESADLIKPAALTNKGAYVVLSLLECKLTQDKVIDALAASVDELKANTENNKGVEVLVEKVNEVINARKAAAKTKTPAKGSAAVKVTPSSQKGSGKKK